MVLRGTRATRWSSCALTGRQRNCNTSTCKQSFMIHSIAASQCLLYLFPFTTPPPPLLPCSVSFFSYLCLHSIVLSFFSSFISSSSFISPSSSSSSSSSPYRKEGVDPLFESEVHDCLPCIELIGNNVSNICYTMDTGCMEKMSSFLSFFVVQ